MDIELKYMDGIRAAYKVREFDRRVLLLFVTNMVQFALEGYAVDATDFIVKPITYPVFPLIWIDLWLSWIITRPAF